METPLSLRIEIITSSSLKPNIKMVIFEKKADKFWMDSASRTSKFMESMTPTPLLHHKTTVTGNYRFDISNDTEETKHTIIDDDDSASCSFSVLSEDTIKYPPPLHLTRFTHDEEVAFFNHIYKILDASFSEWEKRVNYESGKPLPLEKTEDATLHLPHIRDDYVTFGRRLDGQGYWEGRLELTGQYTEIRKLRSHSFGTGISYGVEIGSIQDFESMGGALLFMAVDRNVLY